MYFIFFSQTITHYHFLSFFPSFSHKNPHLIISIFSRFLIRTCLCAFHWGSSSSRRRRWRSERDRSLFFESIRFRSFCFSSFRRSICECFCFIYLFFFAFAVELWYYMIVIGLKLFSKCLIFLLRSMIGLKILSLRTVIHVTDQNLFIYFCCGWIWFNNLMCTSIFAYICLYMHLSALALLLSETN